MRQVVDVDTRYVLIFMLSGGLSSLILGILFYDVGENLAYLIQTAIALILPISIVAVCKSKSRDGTKI